VKAAVHSGPFVGDAEGALALGALKVSSDGAGPETNTTLPPHPPLSPVCDAEALQDVLSYPTHASTLCSLLVSGSHSWNVTTRSVQLGGLELLLASAGGALDFSLRAEGPGAPSQSGGAPPPPSNPHTSSLPPASTLLAQLLSALVASLREEEPSVRRAGERCVRLVGRYCDPEDALGLLLVRVAGDVPGGDTASQV
jgi:hypothetical protein